jgi:hypothetical protein
MYVSLKIYKSIHICQVLSEFLFRENFNYKLQLFSKTKKFLFKQTKFVQDL